MVTECSCPLTSSFTVTASGPTVRSLCKAFVSPANAFADSMTVVAAVTPAPFRNPRRENVVLGPSVMGTAFQMFERQSRLNQRGCESQPYAIFPLYIQRHELRHSQSPRPQQSPLCFQSAIRHSDKSIPRVSGNSKTLRLISM